MGRRSDEKMRGSFLPEWAERMADNHFPISTIAKMAKMGPGTAIKIMTDAKANFEKHSEEKLKKAIEDTSHRCPTCNQTWPQEEKSDAVVRDPGKRGDRRP